MVKRIELEDGIVEKNWQSAEAYMRSQSNKLKDAGINWVIIGAQTKPYKPPKIEWVEEITRACDGVGIPMFHKDNLKPIFPIPTNTLRQEMPKGG